MAASVSSMQATGTSALDSPVRPTTATVLEFQCLFTHDLKRKQKRWQDGRLKYHTFNKRVMVYDGRGNFIGDMHWTSSWEFDEGEEIQLERGGVIVQVSELVHREEQDLSELVDKRTKEKEQRQVGAASRPQSTAPPRSVIPPRTVPRAPQQDHFQLRHRPLHQVIGTPTGHHGRAPAHIESPYEQRHKPDESPDDQDSRASKRRRYDDVPSKSGYAQALFGQTLTLSATPLSSAPIRYRPTPTQEPDSSVVEVSHAAREIPKPALQEQPKASRHFNRPVSEPQSVQSPKEKSVDRIATNRQVEPAKVGRVVASRGKVADDTTPRERRIEVQRRALPVADDDVILIDGPEEPPTEDVCPARSQDDEEEQQNPPRRREQKTTKAAFPENNSTTRVSKSNRARDHDASTKEKNSLKPKTAKPSAAKSATKKRHDDQPTLQSEAIQGSPRTIPDEPRAELRIKPRQKRGLMMMSGYTKALPKKASRDEAGASRTAKETVFTKHQEAVNMDEEDPFRLSSPVAPEEDDVSSARAEQVREIDTAKPTTSFEMEDMIDIDDLGCLFADEQSEVKQSDEAPKTGSPKRTISIELGHDDPFRSPSPQLTVQKADEPRGLSAKSKAISPSKDTVPVEQEDYDPYVLPSSLEDDFPVQHRRARARPRKSFFEDQDETGFRDDEAMLGDSPEVTKRSRSNRAGKKSRRKTTLDDDEELELDGVPHGANKSTYDLDATEDLASDVPEQQPPTKKLRKKPATRKTKAQENEAAFESETEQPAKRRASSRQKRLRDAESEESSGLSEGQESEEEAPKKKQRTGKAGKDRQRPHLAKLKASVKSRELIGFNFDTPNVRQNSRGIGVPFRILSSPLDLEGAGDTAQPEAVEEDDDGFIVDDDEDECSAASAAKSPSPAKPTKVVMTKTPMASEVKDAVQSTPSVNEPSSSPFETMSNARDKEDRGMYERAKVDSLPAPPPARARPQRTKGVTRDQPANDELTPYRNIAILQAVPSIPPTVQKSTVIVQGPNLDATREENYSLDNHDRVGPGPKDDAISNQDNSALQAVPNIAPAVKEKRAAVQRRGSVTLAQVNDTVHPAVAKSSGNDSKVQAVSPVLPTAQPKPVPALQRQASNPTQVNTTETSEFQAEGMVVQQIDDVGAEQSRKTDVECPSVAAIPPAMPPPRSKPVPTLLRQTSNPAQINDTRNGESRENETTIGAVQSGHNDRPFQRQRSFPGLQRQNSITINNMAAGAPQYEPEVTADMIPKSAARLVNPATRGRKAALKSHAAGQTPQHILPAVQPIVVVPAGTPLPAVVVQVQEQPQPKTVKKMTFPGFASAKGEGPWSREAFDLLESGRPV